MLANYNAVHLDLLALRDSRAPSQFPETGIFYHYGLKGNL